MAATKTRSRRKVADALNAQNDYVDSLVEGFRAELAAMVHAAQSRTLAVLQQKLEIVGGRVLQTPANMRALRTLDRVLMDSLGRAGFDALVEEFVSGFNGTLPFFDQILDAISGFKGRPPGIELDKTDLSILESQQITAADGLSSIVEAAGAAAKRKTMYSIAAAPFGEVVDQISATMSASVATASTMAETSLVMFTRTVTDRGFRQIENGLPKAAIKYRYEGPNDKLTRPFCKRMLQQTSGKQLTREQVEKLDNGQLPNPMITGGGYNCRHQWIIEEIQGGSNAKRLR